MGAAHAITAVWRQNYARSNQIRQLQPKNSLCFSQYIMEYPEEAIDYVIVHELAHIKYKNHGREFYALVAQYLPDYQRRSALLKS